MPSTAQKRAFKALGSPSQDPSLLTVQIETLSAFYMQMRHIVEHQYYDVEGACIEFITWQN